jgi:hypothetical protein
MLNRRRFLIASGGTALAWASGCGRSSGPSLSRSDRLKIQNQLRERKELLTLKSTFTIPVDATRRSVPTTEDLLSVAPELKSRLKPTLRLHPRWSTEPTPESSHMGGPFLWPADEAWPLCPRFLVPLAPVLQLLQADAPVQFPFKPGSDLLQVLWSPRDHDGQGPMPFLYWRKQAGNLTVQSPAESEAVFPAYQPLPCRIFPEKLLEFPPWETLPPSASTRTTIAQKYTPDEYEVLRTRAVGNKLGGYPLGRGDQLTATCPNCKRPLDYLLTLSHDDYGGRVTFAPIEEQGTDSPAYRNALGLNLPGTGLQNLFVCQRCPEWPVVAR